MESQPAAGLSAATEGSLTRCQKLLQQEILACEDPICCCEAEPRWLRFGQEDPTAPSEWESAERNSADEL